MSISPVDDSVVVQPDIVTIVTKSFRLPFVSPPTEYDTSLFIRWPLSSIGWLEFKNNRSMSCKSVTFAFDNLDWAVADATVVVVVVDTGCFASIGNTPDRIPPLRLSSLQFWIIFVLLLLLLLLLLAIVSLTVISFASGTIAFRFCSCCCCCCCNCICCWCRWFADVIIALVSVIVPTFGDSFTLASVDVVRFPLWLPLLFGVSALVWWPLPLPLIKFGIRSRLFRAR